MARKMTVGLWVLLLHLSLLLLKPEAADSHAPRQAYIVYMGDTPEDGFSTSSLQTSLLQEVLGSNDVSASLLYSYKKSFNGFAAMLTEDEKTRIAEMDEVISVFPNEKYQLHTTRSWDFMGFSQQVKRTAIESDIIIGVLDTGIWPESESFVDKGFGPPPSKWKGTCQVSSNFTCNNKVIGAQFYRSDGEYDKEDVKSPRDTHGHGTHCASTAAGGAVGMASLMGFGMGTARGGVPAARIAAYKVCWSDGCQAADILAAFDDAIADGVDIISVSLGVGYPKGYFEDPIAIGAFHAMKNGILTSTSGGNAGPDLATISNVAPWFLSVAASTIDRKFLTKLQLGDNQVYQGISLNTFKMQKKYPMIYAGDAPNTTANATGSVSRYCLRGSLNRNLVKGKIVLCDGIDNGIVSNGETALLAGAAGAVMQVTGLRDFASSYPLPAAVVGDDGGRAILNYINSTSNPKATIFKSNEANDTLAPYVVSFSSRGPNLVTTDILKPDIAAPGVDILAAWSQASSVTGVKEDGRRVTYNMVSGTSMACPHASALAAYIKSFHPTWSPAAIKSAMMTTALPLSVETSPEAEFAYGSGHMNPLKATNPGLVYDADPVDYIKLLCGQGYNNTALRLVTGEKTTCSDVGRNGTMWDLNLPSLTLSTMALTPFNQTFKRTVTNVGLPSSTYHARLTNYNSAQALRISVEPTVLTFTSLGQKLGFLVKVEGVIGATRVSASLVWDDGTHQVRTPIVVYASQILPTSWF
ncbi:cucumisin-like [Diospyros lotus]|uniref:cucumisin-like n=1 Tax=Diospyros lotus TaxID=55363 RepID=UPI00225B5871|nr:cucumisin-like [Diospyros lotus]